MHDPNNTTETLDADEAILTYTVSDEAIEDAAGIEGGVTSFIGCRSLLSPCVSA
jgi:hypothetical protein